MKKRKKVALTVDEENEKYLQSIIESEKQLKKTFKIVKKVELVIFLVFLVFLVFLLILVIYSILY